MTCQSRGTTKLTGVMIRVFKFYRSLWKDRKNVFSFCFNVLRIFLSCWNATLWLTVISRLELMGFDTSPHAHRKKFALKYSIKSKYQQNIDYNQLDFHNIIADITVIMSKMQNGAYLSTLRWYLKRSVWSIMVSISLHFLIKVPQTSSNLYPSTSATIDK